MSYRRFATLAAAAAILALAQPARAGELMVFAAASTTNVLGAIGQAFTKETGHKVVFSFASSSDLAKQIEQGAPAAVFLSANQSWMDYLEKRDLVAKGSRIDLLRNEVVLIAPADSPLKELKPAKGLDLAKHLGPDGRLAMGDPAHVPAGLYGKQALTSLGLYDQVKDRVAAAANVRAALALVERGEAPLGIVYATDAAITAKVKVLGAFPADSYDPAVYPAAIVAGHESVEAKAFLAFLRTPQAVAEFKKFGFKVE